MTIRPAFSMAVVCSLFCGTVFAEGPILRDPAAIEYLKQEGGYDSLGEAVAAAMYGVHADPLGFAAPNGRHDFVARFSKAGLRIDGVGWQSSWRLRSVGYGDRQFAVAPARLQADGTRIELRRGAGVTEWYVNGGRGLEQGFTLSRPLSDRPEAAAGLDPGASKERLRLTIGVTGDLTPREAGEAIELARADGTVELLYRHLVVRDAKGRTLVSRMRVLEGAVWLEVEDAGATWPVTVDPTFVQQTYVKASNTGPGDRFGSAVAVSGDTVVVGAYWEDNQSENTELLNSGAAFVFVRNGSTWTQQALLKPSNRGAGDEFGYSVAIDGNTVVIGAHQEDSGSTSVNSTPNENAANAGAAYIFVRSGTAWSQTAYLKASNAGAGDDFGHSVTVSGDTVVVGAPLEDSTYVENPANNSNPDSGAVYVFVRGTPWTQQAFLKSGSDNSASSQFGVVVSVSGDTLAIAWPYFANGSLVNVYQRFGSAWVLLKFLEGPFNSVTSVAASSDGTIVVGDHLVGLNDQGLAQWESGSAHVFIRSGFDWNLQQTLLPSNGESGDWFGFTVAISGETVVVGAIHEDGAAGNQNTNGFPDSGAAYVFARNGATWSQLDYLKASNVEAGDLFGLGIAVSGNTIVVGAHDEDSGAVGVGGSQNNNGATNSGAAYIFFSAVSCSYTLSPTSQNIAAGGGTGSVNVTAPLGCAWSAVSNAGFITVTSGANGSGNGAVNYSASANGSATPRNGTITIAGQTFTVMQAGAVSCTYLLSASSQNVVAGGGSGSVGVSAPVGCAWNAASNDPSFLTVTSGSNGSGNGTVNFSVTANGNANSRNGTLTIGGQTFTVIQSGTGVSCSYTLTPPDAVVGAAGGGGFSVTVTTGAGCAWSAASFSAFLTITGGASGSGSGSFQYSVLANPGSDRIGTISAAGQTFTVAQAAGTIQEVSSNALILSQFVGAGTEWHTTLFVTNLSNTVESYTIRFYDDAGAPKNMPMVNLGPVNTLVGTLAGGQTRRYETETGGTLQVAWAVLNPATPGANRLSGLAVFRQTVPSGASTVSSEAVVDLLRATDGRFVLLFDNQAGFATTAMFANPDPLNTLTIQADLRDEQATTIGTGSIVLAPLGHTAFVLTDRFPSTANRRGSIRLTASPQTFVGLGLRFSPFQTFTSFRLLTSSDIQ